MSLGRSGPGVGNGFLETPRIRFGGVFLASAQTSSQSAGPGASVPCVRHGSQAVDIDHGQLVGRRLSRFAVARERDDKPLAADRAESTAEPEAEDAALVIAAEFARFPRQSSRILQFARRICFDGWTKQGGRCKLG